MVFNQSVGTRGVVLSFLFSRPVMEWVQNRVSMLSLFALIDWYTGFKLFFL